jgi:hypothetical protein
MRACGQGTTCRSAGRLAWLVPPHSSDHASIPTCLLASRIHEVANAVFYNHNLGSLPCCLAAFLLRRRRRRRRRVETLRGQHGGVPTPRHVARARHLTQQVADQRPAQLHPCSGRYGNGVVPVDIHDEPCARGKHSKTKNR